MSPPPDRDGEVGTFLKLWDKLGASSLLHVDDEPRVNAAVSRWVDSGRSRDTLLDLTGVDGDQFYTLASEVTSWLVSTPRGRLLSRQWDRDVGNEQQEHKAQLGIWEDDD